MHHYLQPDTLIAYVFFLLTFVVVVWWLSTTPSSNTGDNGPWSANHDQWR